MKKFASIVLSTLLFLSSFAGLGDLYSYAEEEEVIKIYTVEDLYAINNNMSGNYKLMNDIDLSEATAEGGDYDFMGNGWSPIGSGGKYGSTAFTGSFDGSGFTIKGLRFDVNNTMPSGYGDSVYFGLFAQNEGEIKNLTIDASSKLNINLENIHFIYVGAIAGYNKGTIDNCINYSNIDVHFENNILQSKYQNDDTVSSCYAHIGGISGHNYYAVMKNCGNFGNINYYGKGNSYHHAYDNYTLNYYSCAGSYIGGIAGETTSSISGCFNLGSLNAEINAEILNGSVDYVYSTTAFARVGGIVGVLSEGSLDNSYNTGNILLTRNRTSGLLGQVGGIAGYSGALEINNCYSMGNMNNSTGNGIATGVPILDNCYYIGNGAESQDGAISLTLGQMKNSSSFAGYDFNNTWLIDANSDYQFPQIKTNRQDNKNIETVELQNAPEKLEYLTGDEIDTTEGAVKIYYKDGTSKSVDITSSMVCGYDLSTVGKQTVTVNYRDFTVAYDINVSQKPTAVTMELISEPTTKSFVKGTAFDFAGCQVKIKYDDESIVTKDISPKMTEGGNINQIGSQTITYKEDECSVQFEVKVIPVQVTAIEVASPPTKAKFLEGKTFDADGLKITATYNNGLKKEITDYVIGEIPSSVGKHEVKVTYNGCETSFEVEILEKTAISLSVLSQPTKTDYVIGQEFNTAGMEVQATFDNDDVYSIDDYTVDALPETTGYHNVAVRYQDVETYITVSMIEKQLDSISVKTLPTKTTYLEGEDFDKTGLKVTANYNDGETVDVTDYKLANTSTNKTGTRIVSVIYEGITTTFNITVVEKSLTSLSVTPPDKTIYIEGEEFDDTGLVVKANYNNGKSEKISDYTLTGFGESEEANIITVSYGGKTKSFVVTIHNPEEEWTVTTPATCTTDGEKTLYCADCGEPIKTEVIDAKGHQWGEWISVTSPKCLDKGSRKHICQVEGCGVEEFEDVDATDHNFDTKYTIDKPATCTEEGSKSRHCLNEGCSVTTDVTPIAILEHDEKTELVKATTEEDGYIKVTCKECKQVLTNTKINKIAGIELLETEFTYDGEAKEPEVLVTDSINHQLVEGTDYDVEYKANVKAGTGKVVITFKGNYDGTVTRSFSIAKISLKNSAVNLSALSFDYNGKIQKPDVIVDGLTETDDYSVDYSNSSSVEAGKYTVTVNGEGNYKGNINLEYKINRKQLSDVAISLSQNVFEYNDSVQKPKVTVEGLKQGEDYTVEYSNSTSSNPGKYLVTVEGIGNYSGKEELPYEIKGRFLSDAEITTSKEFYDYTGSQIKPSLVIKYDGKTLVEDQDYEILKYGENIYPGKGTIRIEGMGDYQGKTTVEFNIGQVSGLKVKTQKYNSLTVTWNKQSKVTGYKVYMDGKLVSTIKKASTYSYTASKLTAGSEHSFYVVGYVTKKVNKVSTTYDAPASATINTITLPATATISSATTTAGTITAKWKTASCDGFEVLLATNTKFTSGKQEYKAGSDELAHTFEGLTKGKTYYVKVRTVKEYNGTTYYGAWSSSKKVKCK